MSNKRDVILTLELKHTHPTENTPTITEKTGKNWAKNQGACVINTNSNWGTWMKSLRFCKKKKRTQVLSKLNRHRQNKPGWKLSGKDRPIVAGLMDES